MRVAKNKAKIEPGVQKTERMQLLSENIKTKWKRDLKIWAKNKMQPP